MGGLHAALLRAGSASAGEQESDRLRHRRAEATALVGSARAPAGVTGDEVIDHVVAPIIYRVISLPWTLTDSTAADLVAALLRGR